MRLAVDQPSGAHVATRGMKASLQGCRVESWTKQLGYLCESDTDIVSQATPVAGFLLCAGGGDSAGMVTPLLWVVSVLTAQYIVLLYLAI